MVAVNIAVVSLVFIPYFLLIMIRKKESRKIEKRYKQEVKNLNLEPDHKDRWNQNLIGIDSKEWKLIFVQRRQKEIFVQVIDLLSIKKCEISQRAKLIFANGVNGSVLENIDLELTPHYGGDKILVNIFSSENTFDQKHELVHAENWKKIIESSLSASANYKKVA